MSSQRWTEGAPDQSPVFHTVTADRVMTSYFVSDSELDGLTNFEENATSSAAIGAFMLSTALTLGIESWLESDGGLAVAAVVSLIAAVCFFYWYLNAKSQKKRCVERIKEQSKKAARQSPKAEPAGRSGSAPAGGWEFKRSRSDSEAAGRLPNERARRGR